MAIEQGGRAPYASTGSINLVIEKHRRVPQDEMTLEKLQRLGVTEALAPRTLAALTLLGFYDEAHRATPEFKALQTVPEHDFKSALADLLNAAYAPILEVLDPAEATTLDVENAFRGFTPAGQLPRMAQLFMGLMSYVGLMPEPPRRKRTGGGLPAAKAPRNRSAGERGSSRAADGASEREPVQEHQENRQAFEPPGGLDGHAGERRDVSLGEAGSVSVMVNVRWLDLSEDQFTKLRKLIKDIEALGDSGSDGRERMEAPS